MCSQFDTDECTHCEGGAEPAASSYEVRYVDGSSVLRHDGMSYLCGDCAQGSQFRSWRRANFMKVKLKETQR